ncbi:hypothetical protein ACIBI9_65570 [Nonomuraea sp. NPDC050451]|uniref:hypothetical protein n=1 Tax=Nonomuraea sp. NPDC050451 TaxID=3364364 RepID=UPI0037AD0090
MRIVDPEHWKGLPDGHTRATTSSHGDPADELAVRRRQHEQAGALRFLLARSDAAEVKVGRRPLSIYDQITGTRPFH